MNITYWLSSLRRAVALVLTLSFLASYATFPSVATAQVTEGNECIVTSSVEDYYVEGGTQAVETYVHEAWADGLPDADWIWGHALVQDPANEETQTFTRSFSLTNVPTSGQLEIAVDNGVVITVNGTEVTTLPTSGQNYDDPVDIIDISSYLQAGTNTLEFEVTNLGLSEDPTPQRNPAGLLYKMTAEGSACGEPPTPDPVNTCAVPESEGDSVTLGTTPDPEDTLQELLDAEYAGGAPDAATDQDNIQSWSGGGNDVTFTVKNLSAGSNSANSHVFGYYVNGGSFVPVFREGSVGAPHNAVPELTVGSSDTFTVTGVNDIVFAIADWNGTTYSYYATDDSLNTLSEAHAVSYNIDDNEYALAFEDVLYATGDEDFNDVVVSLHTDECEEGEPTATLVATKIVCPTEDLLPNWGAGNVVTEITEDTASDFLEANPSCHLEEDWDFQWTTDTTDPDDNSTTPLGTPWATFTTDGDGVASTTIPADANIRVREVLQDNYIPFTGEVTDQPESAELYCGTDVLHYDNWEWVDGTDAEETYYCVAFNAPTEGTDVCDANASNVLLSSDSDEGGLVTDDESGPASLVGPFMHESWYDPVDALWIWKDTATSEADALSGTTETFTRTFEVIGTPEDSTLELAVDNSYIVKVNGVTVCEDDGEHNYETTTTCNVPASTLQNGTNTITFEVTNMDHVDVNTPETNPAGLLYKLTVNEDECEVPEQEYASVTMCKIDEHNNPLEGWTLSLNGAHVEDLSVPSTNSAGATTTTSLESGVSYLAHVLGTWTNQGGANVVDAEFSTTDGWTTWMDGYTGYQTDILELQINETFDPANNWGPYSSLHHYMQSFIPSSDGPANFRIFDGTGTTPNEGWYGDNSGSLEVDLSEGYSGVTGANGCVTFSNVPYGTYTAGELTQSGWTYMTTIDGDNELENETVNVNSPSETFTIRNNDTEGNGDTGTLIIQKRIMSEDDGTFTFDIFGENDFSEEVSITTVEGEGDSSSIELEVGTYAVTEDDQTGWELTEVICEQQENEGNISMPNNAVEIEDGETVICTFRNVVTDEETQTIVVTEEDLATDIFDAYFGATEWFFWNDENDTLDNNLGSFVEGPEIAPIGDGSAQMSVTGTERRNIATYQFKDVELADVTELSFATYSHLTGDGDAGATERAPYLHFNVDFNNSDTWQSRLVFVPSVNGAVVADTWQEWDATGAALWTWSRYANGPDNNAGTLADNNTWPDGNTSQYRTWDDLVASFPNIQTRSSDSWFGFRVGEPYANGFTGNVDKFVIGIQNGLSTMTTTYDFEPLDEDVDDENGTLRIVKIANGADAVFTFEVGQNESFEEVQVATEEGDGANNIDLEPGSYSVTEIVPQDWTLTNVTCEYEGESAGSDIPNGHQIQIYEDETVTCTFENDAAPGLAESRGNTDGPNGNPGGGGGGGGGDDDDGEVLGATTEASCGPLLSTFMRSNDVNDPTEVSELQNFLNGELGLTLPLTGIFGPLTEAAVHAFQLKYWQEVLQPWFTIPGSAILDQDDSTGYVYKTTQRMVNNIFCPSLNLPMPSLP